MKSKVIIVGILLTIIFIGGCSMFKNKEAEYEKFRKEQDRMALYLVNHYEGVEKIEFTSFSQNKSTGVWSSDVTVNNTYFFTLNVNNWGDDIDVAEHIKKSGSKELKEKKISSITSLKEVEVQYYD